MNTQTNETAISIQNVRKTFRLPHEKHNSLKSTLINFRRKGYEQQQVLKGLNFDIKKGEFFGIVGRNGSGKSTLLKLLANIYTPTDGQIRLSGKLTPFIELGVGFNPELTGRENVFLNGALLGFSHKEMEQMYSDIVAFAELEAFMDQKLKNYSSGMQVRLAFSIAIRANTDILLIDEVLAVGDAIFQKKCYNYFKELKKNKKTVVFVSHDTNALLEYCDRGVLIEKGTIISEGKIDKVVHAYIDLLNETEEKQTPSAEELHKDKRWGTGAVVVEGVKIARPNGKSTTLFTDKDEEIEITVDFMAKKDVESPVFGITLTDPTGQILFQSNTLWCEVKTRDINPGERISLTWTVPNAFNTGTVQISPATADAVGSVIYDWLEDAASFKIRKNQKSHGAINMRHELGIQYE